MRRPQLGVRTMKVTMRNKLIGGFAIMLILMLGVGLVGISQAGRLKQSTDRIENVAAAGLLNTTILARSTFQVFDLSLQSALLLSETQRKNLAETRVAVEDEIDSSLTALRALARDQGGSLAEDLGAYENLWAEYLRIDQQLADAVDRGDSVSANVLASNQLPASFGPVDAALDTVIEDFQRSVASAAAESDSIYHGARMMIGVILLVFLAFGILVVLWARLVVGRLTDKVKDGAQSIGAATGQILAAVSQHTASASEQSAALSETTTTVDEVRATAEQAAQRAQDVARQAQTSVQVSDDGIKVVEEIVAGMHEIREKVEAIAEDILALSEQTGQISEITATVNDLADQSNMLALNATIEAAKAGEQGKGFAVVATEVKNLADQSKQATAQVQTILNEIQKGTNAAVAATEQGTRVVENGVELTGKAGEVIRTLGDTVRETAQAAAQIAAAAHEQRVGMDQISQAMQDVSGMTGQFVSGAQQSQAAAESLNQLAGHLEEITATY